MTTIRELTVKKTKDQILREEIRHVRDLILRLIQWGVTVLIAIMTATYYIRKDILYRLMETEKLPKNTVFLPWGIYGIGTIFLTIVAIIFSLITFVSINRFNNYKNQLLNMKNLDIIEKPSSTIAIIFIIFLYFLFPIIDICVRFYFTDVSLHVSITSH